MQIMIKTNIKSLKSLLEIKVGKRIVQMPISRCLTITDGSKSWENNVQAVTGFLLSALLDSLSCNKGFYMFSALSVGLSVPTAKEQP